MQVVGRLAEKRPATEQALQGLLVRHGAQDSIMHPADLPYFTKLHPGRVLQRQLLPLDKPFPEVVGPQHAVPDYLGVQHFSKLRRLGICAAYCSEL